MTRKEKWYNYEGPIVDKITEEDLAQQDFVDNTIHRMICELVGQDIEWNIDIIHAVFDVLREKLWEYYKIRIPYAEMEIRDCAWYDEDECGDCEGTEDDFFENCYRDEMFAEMAFQCPNCKKGIINPTFIGTFVCDKCSFEKKQRKWQKFILY